MTEHVIHDYLAGALAGCMGLIVGFPFDTTKVQLQTHSKSGKGGGLRGAVLDINKQGLIRGFFRGMSGPLLSYSFTNSIFFGVYGNTLKYLEKDKSKRKTAYFEIFVAGSLGGAAQLVPVIPIDYVKVVMQSQIPRDRQVSVKGPKSPYFSGPVDCARHMYKTDGLRGLYKGGSAMCMRDIPSYGLYCFTYEYISGWLSRRGWSDSRGIVADLIGGGCAGVIAWLAVMPIDVVKSRFQADCNNQFKNPLDCALKSYRAEGFRVLYRGGIVTCLRGFPVNAVALMVYSQSRTLLENLSDS